MEIKLATNEGTTFFSGAVRLQPRPVLKWFDHALTPRAHALTLLDKTQRRWHHLVDYHPNTPWGITVGIEVQDFIANLERHLSNVEPGRLDSETYLRDLPEWDSLQALVVVASFDWDYGVTISADEFAGTRTISDLHALVSQKLLR